MNIPIQNQNETKKPIFAVLAVVTAITALAIIAVLLFVRHQANDMSAHAFSRQTNFMEQDGILNVSDYTRLTQIQETIQHQQRISDDLDFWIATLHKGPLKDLPAKRMLFYSTVMGCAGGHKNLSPQQQRKMYDAVLPFVSDAAYTDAMDTRGSVGIDPADPTSPQSLRTGQEKMAVRLLAQTRDPRAIGVLNTLAQTSPAPSLRQAAQECSEKLAARLKSKP